MLTMGARPNARACVPCLLPRRYPDVLAAADLTPRSAAAVTRAGADVNHLRLRDFHSFYARRQAFSQ